MKLFFFLALGVALVAALPQNEQTRRRGLRRFSLATPGIQTSVRGKEVMQDLAEEPSVVAEEIVVREEAPQRIKGRGASLLRRGRPSRLRSTQQETEVVKEEVEVKPVEAPTQNNGGGRGSIRIRRPIRKPKKTTTTTPAPVTEELMLQPEGEIVAEESLAMLKDEAEASPSQAETKQMPEKEMKKDIPDEKVAQKSKVEKTEAKPIKQVSPKLKLRPIPIKSARQHITEAPVEPQAVLTADETLKVQEPTSSVSEPALSHRFSSRPRPPRIQARRRQSQSAALEPVQQQTDTASEPAEAPVRQRLRGRGPALRRPASGLASRGRNAVQPASDTPEETPAVDEAAPKNSRLSRFPNLKELKSIVRTDEITEAHQQLEQKPKIIRAKFKRPKATPKLENKVKPVEERPVTQERAVDEAKSNVAPISEAIQQGRPRERQQQKVRQPQFETEDPSPREPLDAPPARLPIPNYGGSDLVIRGGEVQVTQIGTVEDSPIEEVRMILSGLGSRRRGLARPKQVKKAPVMQTQKVTPPVDSQIAASLTEDVPAEDVDYLYEYYDYLYDEAKI